MEQEREIQKVNAALCRRVINEDRNRTVGWLCEQSKAVGASRPNQ